jgi:uncharacterized protein with ParB-like and HNH nuclease domain
MQPQTNNYKAFYSSLISEHKIKMSFGIEKFKTLSISKGKLEMRNSTTESDDTMEAMNEDDIQILGPHAN